MSDYSFTEDIIMAALVCAPLILMMGVVILAEIFGK